MKKLFLLLLLIPSILWAAEPKADKIRNEPHGNISATDVQSAINELDSEKQATGSYLTAETDPVWTSDKASYSTKAQADLLYAPIAITQYTDEMAQDAIGGVIGTGLSYNDTTGAISSTITQYTDALAISAIKGDAAWHAANWDTAYGWGNHANAGYLTGITADSPLSGSGTSASHLTVDLSSKADVGQTFYIGTTQVAINRASDALTLAGLTLTTPNIGEATATSIAIGANTLSSFANLDSLTDLSFASTSFVKMSGANTFSLDTEVYAPDDQTFYIGTTQVAINRASNPLTLAGLTLTTPDIGVATATSIAIGANTLNTTEWAFLDGQDQAVKTTSTPQFLRVGIGAVADADDELYVKLGSVEFNATADVYSQISSGAYLVTRTADTNPALQTYISAGGVQEANPKYVVSISGKNSWGAGGETAVDTNLYRSAANTLKTDDNFIIAGTVLNLSTAQSEVQLNSKTAFSETAAGNMLINGDSEFNALYLYGGIANDIFLGDTNYNDSLTIRSDEISFLTAAGTYKFFANASGVDIGSNTPVPAEFTDITLEVTGATSPSLTINDTGQASPWGIMAIGDRLELKYGASDFWFTIDNTAGKIGLGTYRQTEALTLASGYKIGWEASAGVVDTNLYRSAANTLMTDDSLTVGTNLTVNGNTVLGNASTDTCTNTGRMILRTLASNPKDATPANRPAGSVAEIAYYSGKMYFCTNSSTPTWELITSS